MLLVTSIRHLIDVFDGLTGVELSVVRSERCSIFGNTLNPAALDRQIRRVLRPTVPVARLSPSRARRSAVEESPAVLITDGTITPDGDHPGLASAVKLPKTSTVFPRVFVIFTEKKPRSRIIVITPNYLRINVSLLRPLN